MRRRLAADAARLQRLSGDDRDAADNQYGGCDLWQWSLAGVFILVQLAIVLLTTFDSTIHPPVVTHILLLLRTLP